MATEQTQLGSQNVQQTLSNLGQNKRMVMVGAVFITVIIAMIIVIFAWTKGTSKGSVLSLVKGIDQGRAFEIVSKLESNDIESTIVDGDTPGKVTVNVHEKTFDKAALLLARSDLLQEDGYSLFDKSDWASSDYEKRVKMGRAINGDLSRIVSRMSGIKWATVRINVPEQQLFSQFQAPTTATVQLELTESQTKLPRNQVKSIINLLVGYVPNLQKDSISIVDTSGETYSTVDTEEVVASDMLEETEKVNQVVQKRIEDYLQRIVGTNNFIVRVSSEISRKKVEESATTFAEGVVGQEQIGDEILGGAPGTDIAAAGPAVPGDGSKSYTRSNKVIQRYPSFKQKTTSTPPGTISRVAVAVAINGGLPPTISMKELREGVAAITSPSTTVEDIKITVTEFASPSVVSKSKGIKQNFATQDSNFVGQTTNLMQDSIGQLLGIFKRMPLWGNIAVIIIGLLIVFNSIGLLFRPPAQPQQSTIAQINSRMHGAPQQMQTPQIAGRQTQAMQQQAMFEEEQEPQKIASEEKADLAGVLSGLQEAAAKQPQALANKLEIWLEEGSTANRA
ncbi:MAG: flagellar M-ring protein FliF [Candidatus Melainabacteria bacterium]|nr:flagellar M-ring protein FliF [Candidatus Melainabacteria bacterium]MBI3308411.1 flagellar M-ring protein FliF [Candidatus Melainabacteria bacterium]